MGLVMTTIDSGRKLIGVNAHLKSHGSFRDLRQQANPVTDLFLWFRRLYYVILRTFLTCLLF